METVEIGTSGPALVLLHGNDLRAAFYAPLARALAGLGVRTTLVTLPGFGHEPPLKEPSWTALAETVVEVTRTVARAHGPCVLAGHSMGGLLALLAAARRPPSVAGLALLEPAIFPGRALAAIAAARYRRTVVEAKGGFRNHNGGMRRIAELAAFPAEALAIYDDTRAHSDAATVRALFATLPALHPLPWADVTVPTLLVRGARSGAFARFIAGAVGRSLRHVSLDVAVVPGAAHWLANENDDAVAAALAPFVGAVTRSGATHG